MLETGLLLLATVALVLFAWTISSALLIIFAGVLVAALLDALVRGLERILPIARKWRVAIVLVLFALVLGGAALWSIQKLPEQTRLLVSVMERQLDILQKYLLDYGVDLLGPEGGKTFAQWLFSDQARLLSQAQFVIGGASNFVVQTFIVLFLGVLFALDPAVYRDSLVRLAKPSYRDTLRKALDEMGSALRFWFVGQLARVFCVWATLYLFGLPSPFLLGLQAGLANFIPYLGPIIAAAPIGLSAMPYGASILIWSLVTYSIIQSVEGYVIGPLIQRQAIETPPAWILVAIVVFGAMFGVLGIAMAMPLVAVLRVAIVRLYIEDYLGSSRSKSKS
ncbi:MAG TPA: AI-2E family transporter [Xanthobacteraceae bacterium]|nr:AI-2E family transporter [Xanthobacteraceae bacterium]